MTAADGTVRVEDLRERVVARLHLPVIPFSGAPPVPEAPPALPGTGLSLGEVLAILQRTGAGEDPVAIATQIDRSAGEVEAVVRAATALMGLLTQKESPRLAKPEAVGRLVLPTARFARRDAAVLRRLIAALEARPVEDRLAWATTVLNRSDRHRSGPSFRDAKAARAWLDLCPEALPASAIRVTVLLDAGRDGEVAVSRWREALGPDVRIRTRPLRAKRSRSDTGRGILGMAFGRRTNGEHGGFQVLRRAAFLVAVADEMRGMANAPPVGGEPFRLDEECGLDRRLGRRNPAA